MTLSDVSLAFVVSMFPTLAMLGASALLTNYEVGPATEACFQNFAAGLILSAVAGELFPIMANASDKNSCGGITIGFIFGLLIVYGLERVVGYLENLPPSIFEAVKSEDGDVEVVSYMHGGDKLSPPRRRSFTFPEKQGGEDDIEEGSDHEEGRTRLGSADDWEREPIHRASIAIAAPAHKDHIREHLKELLDTVNSMEQKSEILLDRGHELSVRQAEDIAEKIDEEVHMLQYKLDHVRRLLQGSESDVLTHHTFADGTQSPATSHWVTEDRKLSMKKKLRKIKGTVLHLVEHVNDPEIDMHILHEMYEHMSTMDLQIKKFHDIVERNASKWRRNATLPETQIGDKLPVNLILPVTIDCFVDGFLIGLSVAISPKAGFILAVANCFEMSFLGMAYASRLVKCTGTTLLRRNIALYGPPFVMFFAAGVGAAMASAVSHIPLLFIAFVAFGVVALLFLVCNELLIEAKNAQGEEEKWWISICIFLGIYMVLIVNQLIPGNDA